MTGDWRFGAVALSVAPSDPALLLDGVVALGVFVVLQDTLTVGEQMLNQAGQGQAVLDLRRRWQGVMEADVSREVEALTGRKVVGFMSDNHIDPDLAVEVFVLEPVADAPAEAPSHG